MRAVAFREVGRVEIIEVDEPDLLDAGDAIVRVSLAGICGSDLHFFHGKAPLEPGEIIGHEAVGVVELVGPAVERFRPGDRVAVSFVIACGRCWFCDKGQTQLCEEVRYLGAGVFGGSLPGAQAELVRVPAADVNLLGLPDDVEDEPALFLGDVGTTGVYAAGLSAIESGETVAVVGAGPVGFFAIQAARAAGAGEVLALDRVPERLALAEGVGAVPIDVGARNAQTAVDERTGGRGADVAIDAVGDPAAFERTVDIVRRGGRVVVVGMYTSEVVPIQLGVWWTRALQIRVAGVCPVHAWWERALEMVRDGTLDPDPLVSHRLALEEAPLGYELFDARRATKVLLRP
jgi:2-desacetyl-2-hydroxyethyl bacteriochlorophyllide A dehydrogenase